MSPHFAGNKNIAYFLLPFVAGSRSFLALKNRETMKNPQASIRYQVPKSDQRAGQKRSGIWQSRAGTVVEIAYESRENP